MHDTPSRRRARRRGVTLIEGMLALAISTVVIATVTFAVTDLSTKLKGRAAGRTMDVFAAAARAWARDNAGVVRENILDSADDTWTLDNLYGMPDNGSSVDELRIAGYLPNTFGQRDTFANDLVVHFAGSGNPRTFHMLATSQGDAPSPSPTARIAAARAADGGGFRVPDSDNVFRSLTGSEIDLGEPNSFAGVDPARIAFGKLRTLRITDSAVLSEPFLKRERDPDAPAHNTMGQDMAFGGHVTDGGEPAPAYIDQVADMTFTNLSLPPTADIDDGEAAPEQARMSRALFDATIVPPCALTEDELQQAYNENQGNMRCADAVIPYQACPEDAERAIYAFPVAYSHERDSGSRPIRHFRAFAQNVDLNSDAEDDAWIARLEVTAADNSGNATTSLMTPDKGWAAVNALPRCE